MPADERKIAYFEQLGQLLDANSMILIVNADNVRSSQLQRIRVGLRGRATILMGKNTMMRKAIRAKVDSSNGYDSLMQLLIGNVGLVFVHKDVREVRKIIAANQVGAPAKAGAISPIDVTVPAGNTGMDPNQTSFFQVLNIPTKINKGTVEIVNDVALLKKGDRVGSSEAALLAKLNIRPFSYGLNILQIFDEGSVYEDSVLDISEEDLISHFQAGVDRVTAVSLAVSYPCKTAVPQFVTRAFNNLVAIAAVTPITFKQVKEIKEYLADPSKFAAKAPAPAKEEKKPEKAEAKVEAKVEKKPKEPEPEPEDGDMGFGLFD
jgi:large subunit ribosomal protein LP0